MRGGGAARGSLLGKMLVVSTCWPSACAEGKAPGLPSGFALKAPSVPFRSALKDLDLPLIPGSQALQGIGPVFLAKPSQCRRHDGADSDPLIKAAASQHVNQHSQPDQPHRRLMGQDLKSADSVPARCCRPEAWLLPACGRPGLMMSCRLLYPPPGMSLVNSACPKLLRPPGLGGVWGRHQAGPQRR